MIKDMYRRFQIWANGTCTVHPDVILSGSLFDPCDKCFEVRRKEFHEAIKAEEERKWHGQAKAVIDELDKRGLIVTHPSYLKGGKRT